MTDSSQPWSTGATETGSKRYCSTAPPLQASKPFLVVRRRRLIQPHPEAESHRRQDLLDLVQRLAAEILGLEHLAFGLLHQLANRADVRVLEAVVGPDGELQFFDALVEVLVDRRRRGLA